MCFLIIVYLFNSVTPIIFSIGMRHTLHDFFRFHCLENVIIKMSSWNAPKQCNKAKVILYQALFCCFLFTYGVETRKI